MRDSWGLTHSMVIRCGRGSATASSPQCRRRRQTEGQHERDRPARFTPGDRRLRVGRMECEGSNQQGAVTEKEGAKLGSLVKERSIAPRPGPGVLMIQRMDIRQTRRENGRGGREPFDGRSAEALVDVLVAVFVQAVARKVSAFGAFGATVRVRMRRSVLLVRVQMRLGPSRFKPMQRRVVMRAVQVSDEHEQMDKTHGPIRSPSGPACQGADAPQRKMRAQPPSPLP